MADMENPGKKVEDDPVFINNEWKRLMAFQKGLR